MGTMAAPVLDTGRPHVRLGLAWAVVTTAAAVAGPLPLGAWFAVAAAAAALQGARTFKRARDRPDRLGAAFAAVLPPIAAALGPWGAVLGGALGGVGAWLRGAGAGAPGRTVLAGLPYGLAGAAPVVLRTRGLAEAAALLALVWVYDAGAFIVGAGVGNRWEGPAAGIAGMGAITLGIAAVLVPPFEGASAWALGAAAAVLAPVGTLVATALLGGPKADAPAVRRLDSLLLAGPAFTVAGLALLS